MVLKELFLNSLTFGGYGGPEKTVYTLRECSGLERTDF